MKYLYKYISESILDPTNKSKVGRDIDGKIRDGVLEFIGQNYHGSGMKDVVVPDKPNEKGLYEVTAVGYCGFISFNGKGESLTNGHFVWKEVDSFNCAESNITSLEGSPEKVRYGFECQFCDKLKSLKGGPKEVGDFYCDGCLGLTDLVGAPRKANHFQCRLCEYITSLKGCPKTLKSFDCDKCLDLKSLEHGPKNVKDWYMCYECGGNFTSADVTKYCKVGGEIITIDPDAE